MDAKIATRLLEMQTQLRVYHWQATSLSKHTVLGSAYDDLSELVDNFVEILMGAEGVVAIAPLKVHNRNEKDALEYCEDAIEDLRRMRDEVEVYHDLAAIADEMIGVFGKLKYLLRLK